MKLLVLTAIIAAVASSPLTQGETWPWQVGKEYTYDVKTYTWSKFDESNKNGNAFKAQFVIRVLAPGHLMAKLNKPSYSLLNHEIINYSSWPSGLSYEPIKITDQPFEIFVEGGRVKSLTVPTSLSLSHENFLKGLISAFQVDLSTYGRVHNFPNSFDKETFQGLFKKMEADVTGACETMYTVSPVSADWRRELPVFASEEDPIEIIKSKNYGTCQKRVAFNYGVPEGALWSGIANENDETQLVKHTSETRVLAGKQGTIFKSESMSSVFVSPLMFGKQKAEVFSFVEAHLASMKPISDVEWTKTEEFRTLDSLLFTLKNSIFESKVRIFDAKKLLHEMSSTLPDRNKLSKTDFLAKFRILVGIIGALRPGEVGNLTSSIEIVKSSEDVFKQNMWTIYRDAVAQAGSVAAFEQIKSWILNKDVQGEEAAQLISGIGSSIIFPTKKVMADFFNFAMNPEVRESKFVNNSALLAATKLTRFGKEDLFVVETVIPRLAEELLKAVENGDSNKAQVFVRALNNLANPNILKIFAPYLDGRIVVTKYLRIQMVTGLKTLANLRDETVRAVLYSILRNTAEHYEVRVAAALNIFLAFPTAEMMQIMARMTNEDPSMQVRAVLANSITFAARLKAPRFAELAKTAQSVQHVVAKEKFGYRYSTDSMIDSYMSEDEYTYFRELSFIGSEDSILPKYQRSALRTRGNGWTEENQITLAVSDVQQILEYIAQLVYEPTKSKVDLKFSAQKIIEMLKIKRDPRNPIEGTLFLENLNQQKLITFTEEDLKAFIASTIANMEKLFKGVDVQYTKILLQRQTMVVLPLVSGMPFFFEYNEPLMYSLNGQAKIKFDKGSKDFAGSLNQELEFTYTRNLDGLVGYIDTLGEKYIYTGVVNKILFNFPVKMNTVVEPGDIKLKFEMPEKDTTFVHFSVWPYTTQQSTVYLLPISENPATKYIERQAKTVSTDLKIGDFFGLSFQLQGYSYSNDYTDPKKYYEADLLTSFGNLMYQKDVALTEYNLKYIAKETINKEITFSAFFDTLYNQKHGGELGPAALVKDVSANSVARRDELVKRVAAGIDSAQVQLADISVVFDGQKKVEYVLTSAIAHNFVDNKVQGIFFFNGWEQLNAVFKMVTPKVVPLNFKEALKNGINLTYEADLKYGASDSIQVTGFSERTKQYSELLSKDPMVKHCLEEMSKDNFYQMDCYKMIIKAHAPDYGKTTVTYKELTPMFLNLTYSAYDYFKQMYGFKQDENIFKISDNGRLTIEFQNFYYENYINYILTSSYGVLRFNNVESLPYLQYANAYYAPITDWERARNWFTGYQNLPYCAVDSSKIWTFGGRSYEYSLSGSWHVVMVDEANDSGRWIDLVILARRPSANQEEVYVSYKTETGKYVELDIKPTSVDVKTNSKKVSSGPLTTYWNEDEDIPLLEYYTLADGILMFNINNGAIRFMYDSQRLVIFTDAHRSYTRGICGMSTSEPRDDYMTPWGLVDLPEHYGASFSLEGELSDPKTVELKKNAKLKAYQPMTKYTNILRSDAAWTKAENDSVKGF